MSSVRKVHASLAVRPGHETRCMLARVLKQ